MWNTFKTSETTSSKTEININLGLLKLVPCLPLGADVAVRDS